MPTRDEILDRCLGITCDLRRMVDGSKLIDFKASDALLFLDGLAVSLSLNGAHLSYLIFECSREVDARNRQARLAEAVTQPEKPSQIVKISARKG